MTSAADQPGIVIIGGSVAGVRAARALRQRGYDGALTMLEAEPHEPYDKPPLSKSTDDDPVLPLLIPGEVQKWNLDLRLGVRVTHIDHERRRVRTESDSPEHESDLQYRTLILASGVVARDAPWDVPGLLVLRTREDAIRLRQRLRSAQRLLIVGGGFIGTEVASMAHQLGVSTTIVDVAAEPMLPTAGPHLADVVRGLLEAHDVDVRFGSTVEELEYDGQQYAARLSDGARLTADLVLVGIGTTLRAQWLVASGFPVDDGVLCDSSGAVLRIPDCFAVGDIARWARTDGNPARRVEHWTNAVEQANVVAWNLTHPDETRSWDAVDYLWSDQFGRKLQMVGRCAAGPGDLQASDAEEVRSVSVWTDGDRITGASTVDWPRLSIALRRAIAAGESPREVRELIAAHGGVLR